MARSPQDPDPADRDDLEPDEDDAVSDQDLPSESDSAPGDLATWTPPRGRLTHIVAWAIIALVLLGTLAMLAALLWPR